MFGPVMQFRAGELPVRMAPLRREDMPLFVCNGDDLGGMQCYKVTRYLGHQIAPTVEGEYQWYDKICEDPISTVWGIYVQVDGKWQVIGNTVLNTITDRLYRGAVSGFLIFNTQYWGKGIASHCHRARTMFAFEQMAFTVVRSAVATANPASSKSIEGVGYVEVSHERNQSFVNGAWVHQRNFEMVNPNPTFWDAWWHADEPGAEFLAARQRTLDAIEWANQHVELQ